MSKRPVAIVGVGQTDYTSKREDVGLTGLVREAVDNALDDCGLRPDDVDAVVLGSAPLGLEGTNLNEKLLVDAARARFKPYMRIHTGGSVGGSVGIGGYYHVASGEHDVVLSVCFQKLSETNDPQYWLSVTYDPLWAREVGVGAPGMCALQAHQYMARFPHVTEEHLAKIASLYRGHGVNNPHSHLQEAISVEEALDTRMVVSPLRLSDCCPASDGACAVVYAAGDRAEELADRPAWVTGTSTMAEAAFHPAQDFTTGPSCVEAARRVYEQAGINDPRRELDVAEIYVAFTHQLLIWGECFGIADPGELAGLIDDGLGQMDSELPISPSGGVLCSNAIGATGLIRIAEAALQVMGKAGDRQVNDAKRALAHAWGGWLQFHTAMILSADREEVAA